jgi:hypothetical protein
MSKPNIEIFDNEIYYYKRLISNPNALMQKINDLDKSLLESDMIGKWYTWKSSNDDFVFGERKDIFPDKYSSSSKDIIEIYDTIYNAMNSALEDYKQRSGKNLDKAIPRTISKYYTNSFMGPHTDSGPRAYISGVFYLNDNYSGGELEFPNQGIKIKPSAGSMIFFPSVEPFVHDPKVVLSGEKCIIPMFWYKD